MAPVLIRRCVAAAALPDRSAAASAGLSAGLSAGVSAGVLAGVLAGGVACGTAPAPRGTAPVAAPRPDDARPPTTPRPGDAGRASTPPAPKAPAGLAGVAAQATALFVALADALDGSGEDCARAAARLVELADRHRDALAASAALHRAGRDDALRAALRAHAGALERAAARIAAAPTIGACGEDPAFASALARLMGEAQEPGGADAQEPGDAAAHEPGGADAQEPGGADAPPSPP